MGELLRKLYISIVSLWTWFVLGACLVLWMPMLALLLVITLPWDKQRYWVGLWFRKLAVVTCTLNPLWRFRTSGTFPANRRGPFIAVSNHESFVDILLISHLPWEMKWLSKIEIMRIPVLGWDMVLAGDIPVERGTAKSAVKAMQRCTEVLKGGGSVIIFPEGTRSETEEMLPFKDGAFRLAIDNGVPILPLVVRGTGTALPKHGWRFGKSNAEVRVLPLISTTGMGRPDVKKLSEQVRAVIETERQRMRLEQR
jgi:1-acyl-sn-glycerol-3-phosphate acyltransferase